MDRRTCKKVDESETREGKNKVRWWAAQHGQPGNDTRRYSKRWAVHTGAELREGV